MVYRCVCVGLQVFHILMYLQDCMIIYPACGASVGRVGERGEGKPHVWLVGGGYWCVQKGARAHRL